MTTATKRRLHDELNIEVPLESVYRFQYQAGFGELGSEHELCHVFLGRIDSEPCPNENEISGIRYVTAAELESDLLVNPDCYTPWFTLEWKALTERYSEILARYARPGQPT